MTRPRLRIVCQEHDRVISVVVDTDDGPAYGTNMPMRALMEALGGADLELGLHRAARREKRTPALLLLDLSTDPIESPMPYQLAQRGPFPAWCPRCHRSRGDLELRDLLKRGTVRI